MLYSPLFHRGCWVSDNRRAPRIYPIISQCIISFRNCNIHIQYRILICNNTNEIKYKILNSNASNQILKLHTTDQKKQYNICIIQNIGIQQQKEMLVINMFRWVDSLPYRWDNFDSNLSCTCHFENWEGVFEPNLVNVCVFERLEYWITISSQENQGDELERLLRDPDANVNVQNSVRNYMTS